jgi:hypothetical protein
MTFPKTAPAAGNAHPRNTGFPQSTFHVARMTRALLIRRDLRYRADYRAMQGNARRSVLQR